MKTFFNFLYIYTPPLTMNTIHAPWETSSIKDTPYPSEGRRPPVILNTIKTKIMEDLQQGLQQEQKTANDGLKTVALDALTHSRGYRRAINRIEGKTFVPEGAKFEKSKYGYSLPLQGADGMVHYYPVRGTSPENGEPDHSAPMQLPDGSYIVIHRTSQYNGEDKSGLYFCSTKLYNELTE